MTCYLVTLVADDDVDRGAATIRVDVNAGQVQVTELAQPGAGRSGPRLDLAAVRRAFTPARASRRPISRVVRRVGSAGPS